MMVRALLAAIHVDAALGTADSMIEWRWFDLEATIYGGRAQPEEAAGFRFLRARALELTRIRM